MGPVAVHRLIAAAFVAAGAAARAHVPEPAASSGWTPVWTFEPWVVLPLALAAALYAAGLVRLWRRAGTGRGVRRARVLAFAGGWSTLVVALVSPLDALGVQLFSAHMVQHELLMIVAAPLLVLGRPISAWAWALPPRWAAGLGRATRRRAVRVAWRTISTPLPAWTLHALALWLWHVPAAFDAALRSPELHVWQHLSFLVSALLFWWPALGPAGRERLGSGLIYLFTTMVHTAALGALLTLSPLPWYAGYAATTGRLGVDALEDQQLGGLVMWVPAGLVYLASALVLAARWLEPGAHRAATGARVAR
jgi:putative membrane protein